MTPKYLFTGTLQSAYCKGISRPIREPRRISTQDDDGCIITCAQVSGLWQKRASARCLLGRRWRRGALCPRYPQCASKLSPTFRVAIAHNNKAPFFSLKSPPVPHLLCAATVAHCSPRSARRCCAANLSVLLAAHRKVLAGHKSGW